MLVGKKKKKHVAKMGFRHLSKPSAMTYVRQNRIAGVCRIFDYPMLGGSSQLGSG